MGQRNKIRVSIHDVYRPVHTAVCTQVYIEYTSWASNLRTAQLEDFSKIEHVSEI